MYCIVFSYVLIIIFHISYTTLAQREPISIMEEYLQRRGDTKSNFDYNFSGAFPSGDVQPVRKALHNYTQGKHSRNLEDGNRETLVDFNREKTGESHISLPEKLRDITGENEAQEKQPDEILDELEPNYLPIDPDIYKPIFQRHDSRQLLINDKPNIQAHELSNHDTLEKQALNIPDLEIHDIPVLTAMSKPMNNNEFIKNRPYNYINYQQTLNEDPESNDIMKNKKRAVINEVYSDTSVTTKKSHYIRKPSTPLDEPDDTFQMALKNDLKYAVEDKTTNRPRERLQKPKTAQKIRKASDDEAQRINFKDIYTSSDNEKDSMLKNIHQKSITPFKDKPVSEEKQLVDFRDIYQTFYEKKVTSKVQYENGKLTTKIENLTADEPVLTDSEDYDDNLKKYYNRGKLITGQTVKDIIDGKNEFAAYNNEYSIRSRRNLGQYEKPNTGEEVNEDTHIPNYDPDEGTIDGLGPIKNDNNITNNGTHAKKHHHHHKHHKHHNEKNITRPTPAGFPGKIVNRKGPFFYDDLDDSSKELQIINQEQNGGRGSPDYNRGMPNEDDLPGMGDAARIGGLGGGGGMGGLGGSMHFPGDPMGGPMGDPGGPMGGPDGALDYPGGPMGGMRFPGGQMGGGDRPVGRQGGPMGRETYGPNSPMDDPGGPIPMNEQGSMYAMGRPGNPRGIPMGGPGGAGRHPFGPINGPGGNSMGRAPMPLKTEDFATMVPERDLRHEPNIDANGAMAVFPGGNLDSENDYSPGANFGPPPGMKQALRNGGFMGGSGDPMGGPGGSMGRSGGPIGGPGGFMGGQGDPMRESVGPTDNRYGYEIEPGSPMYGSGPMGGPGGPMGGPGGPMGGPGGPMGGPRGPMGGPGGPMGGPGERMGGPGGRMDGPGGPMGGPGGPMGGPGGPMGGPGNAQDYMGDPGGPMGGPGNSMGGPPDYMNGPGGPMGRPGGEMRGPMGGPEGPMGGPQDYMDRHGGAMGSQMGGYGDPMRGPGGSMGGPGGPMGGPGGPMGGLSGPMGGPGGPMGGPGGPMGGPGGPMGGQGGPMGGPGGPMGGPNYDGPIDPDYYGGGGSNARLRTMQIPNQAGINQQSQYGVYNQVGPGYGPGAYGVQPYGNPGAMGLRQPNMQYTQPPLDPGGPLDPESGGILGVDGDPNYIKMVREGKIKITVSTDRQDYLSATTALGRLGVQPVMPNMPGNFGSQPNGPNMSGRNGFLQNAPNMQTFNGPQIMSDNNGFPKLQPNAPYMNGNPSNNLNMQGFNGPQNGPNLSGFSTNMPVTPNVPQSGSVMSGNIELLSSGYSIDGTGGRNSYTDNQSTPKRISPPKPGYLVPLSTTPHDFPRENVGSPGQTPVSGDPAPPPTNILKTDAENRTVRDNDMIMTKEITKQTIPNTTNVTTTTTTTKTTTTATTTTPTTTTTPKTTTTPTTTTTLGITSTTTQSSTITTIISETKAAIGNKLVTAPSHNPYITAPSVKYDNQGKPIMSTISMYPPYHEGDSAETEPAVTTEDPLKAPIDLYPDPPPKPAAISTPASIATSSRPPSYPFRDQILDQAQKLNNGMVTMFFIKLTEILAKMVSSDVLSLVKQFSGLLRNDDVYLHFMFYGEPFRILFVEKMEMISNMPSDECQHLAAELYQELITRQDTLSSDMNSILDFADKIITKEEGETFIRLLEKVLLYPQMFDAAEISRRIVDVVFFNPLDRLMQSSSRRRFLEGLNSYLAAKYRNGGAISIPDPPIGRRQGVTPISNVGLTLKLNDTLTTRSPYVSSKARDLLTTIPIIDRINDNSEKVRIFSEILDNNNRRSIINRRQYRMKGEKPKRKIMNTNEPMLNIQQPMYSKYIRNEKTRQFVRRLKEMSFKKNIAPIRKDIDKKCSEDYNNFDDNNTEKRNDGYQLNRRQFNPIDTDNMKTDVDLLSDFNMPSTTFPHTFLELVINDETTRNSQFRAFDIPQEIEMNNGKNIPTVYSVGRQHSPPGFPPDMFKPPSKPVEEKNNIKTNNFNPLNLNPNNYSPLNLSPNNFNPVNFNPNNLTPLKLPTPNRFNPGNFNTDNLNPTKPPDLPDRLRILPNKLPFDQSGKTDTGNVFTIPSRTVAVDMMTIGVRPRNDEELKLKQRKGPKTRMKKKRKKKRKSMRTSSTKKGLKDQIKKYVDYAKDIIKTKVHTMEKKIKKMEHSKDIVNVDGKKETNSLEKKESKISEEMKFIENNSKGQKSYEKKNKEKESLESKDSDISEIMDDDDNYDIEKESREKPYKRRKHKKKKKRRRHLRNVNKKYKTSHKHRRVHKKHRRNKRKKHHKHKHKKHHKYRYLVLEGVRRGNLRGRSDLYSVERTKPDNGSASNSQDISRTNTENEGYSEDNNDYQALRKNSMVGTMLNRNTRFYIVKNVRSTVSTSDQPDSNNWSFHKRFNIIGNNNIQPNMTIISATLDIDRKKSSVFNGTEVKSVKTNEYTADSSSSDSSSSTESSDGLPIDKWVQGPIPTNESETLVTTSITPITTIYPKQNKRKYLGEQKNLENEDVFNDTDYLSRNEEAIFNDWLRTVDRLKITQLNYRRSNKRFKSTLRPKYTTKKNVKSILFFKASDEFDRSIWRQEIQKETSSCEVDISQHFNKHATRKNNDMNPEIKFSRKLSKATKSKSSVEISQAIKEFLINDTNEMTYHNYKTSIKRSRPELVKNRKIRKRNKNGQSREKGLVKNLAHEFRVLEKINKKFDNEKPINIHRNIKHNSTEVTQELHVDKPSELDLWMPDYRNDDSDKSEADNIFQYSSHRNTDFQDKQNATNTIILAKDSSRETTERGKQTTRKAQAERSIEVTTLLHRVKDTDKIVIKDYEYEPVSYYSEILTTTDQTITLRNEDLTIELHEEPVTLKQHSKEPSSGTDFNIELNSDEGPNVPEETHIATKILRRNKRIENWQRKFSNTSTLLPQKIRMKILKKLSEITNYNNPIRRHNNVLKKVDVSEISDEERILKSNIYKYFGDSEKMKEHDEFNKNMSSVTNGDSARRLLGIELNNDTSRSDITDELD